MKKAQSERMKGKAPVAAIEAAKKWRKENGGYWKGKKRTEETIEKMRNAQQEKAIKILAHYPDGKEKEFDSMALFYPLTLTFTTMKMLYFCVIKIK